ncbi:transport and Golgi organization protein 6 [Anopheles maculipalpis]|uniref:transport and Golgi organization protein 6 n=1 Tax=Anopheles maculipalpis TaxID=1496333 RepID=UPI0021592C61|nr:transport and Golgi organization protein 6 [Anopheles maculipalpis]
MDTDVKTLREAIACIANLMPKACLEAAKCVPFPTEDTCSDILWKTTVQYCFLLTEFGDKGLVETQNQSAESEEVINLHDQASYLKTIDLLRQFTLHLYLPRELRGLSQCDSQLMVMVEEEERIRRLSYCVAQFERIFEKKMLALHPRLADTVIDYIAARYTLSKASLAEKWKGFAFPKDLIFRSLLVIKGAPGLSLELAKVLHIDLLHLTGEPGGFSALCKTLFSAGKSDENAPSWHKSEIVAKIVSSKGHTKQFYRQVLNDCFEFYHWAVQTGTEQALVYAATCIECLKRIFQLPAPYRELHLRIEEHFFLRFQELAAPKELVAGCVLQERNTLANNLYVCSMAFTGSTFTSLPSSLLVPYVHLFLRLYSLLLSTFDEQKYLHSMIVFCLTNRSKDELKRIILSLLLNVRDVEIGRHLLHPRIVVKYTDNETNYSLQIGPSVSDDNPGGDNLLPTLINLLKSSNRNLLLYDVFLVLLSELMTGSCIVKSFEPKQLLDAVERDKLLCDRFHQKYILIQSLMDLINHKHFHAQLYDNSGEVLNILAASFTTIINDSNEMKDTDSNSDVLEVVLSIFQEFFQRNRNRHEMEGVLKLLHHYRNSKSCSEAMKVQIDLLCNGLSTEHDGLSESACQNALSLCSDQQPYCKVYGTTLLLKLLKERDPETYAQLHKILILALVNLRDEESYAFLNSVRLLVALCDVLEAEVIDALVKEYLNESNDTDYRLKVGEATVKTVETLGPFAVRYRDTLLNCFLAGTRHAVEEFRTSSLSNLGSICHILSYQVHHFFYELFTCIKSIVDTDSYLPARRAAILVLSQLLEGFDSLMDLQEYLLLIYRFLKHVISTDNDDITKLQAAVALDHLKAKTKVFLQIDPHKLEKRMFGRVI